MAPQLEHLSDLKAELGAMFLIGCWLHVATWSRGTGMTVLEWYQEHVSDAFFGDFFAISSFGGFGSPLTPVKYVLGELAHIMGSAKRVIRVFSFKHRLCSTSKRD